MKNLHKVSIVVCTYNGSRTIKNCINALIAQTYSKNSYEIIVVDDASIDDTKNILEIYKNIRIINNINNKGLSASRNVGIKAAKGEIITFTDDDCIPDKNWISNLVKEYKNNNIVSVGGKVIPGNKSKNILSKYLKANNPLEPLELNLLHSNNIFYRFYLYIKKPFENEIKKQNIRNVYSLVGANMSFKKSFLYKMGLFDETIKFGCDEEDLFKRINDKFPNYQIIFSSNVIIRHDFDLRIESILRRSASYGKGNAQMHFKHRNYNLTIYPFPMLVILCLGLSFIDLSFIYIVILLPIILYINWLIKLINEREIYYLFFPYIQTLQEFFNNIGVLKGILLYRNKYLI